MRRIAWVSRAFAAFYLIGISSAMEADQLIRAEVQSPVVTLETSQDPEIALLRFKFDVRLTNGSSEAIYVPQEGGPDRETTRFALLAVEVKQPDGKWVAVAQSSWYDVGTTKYAACNPVGPGKTAAFGAVTSGFVVLRKQLDALEKEPSIRLHLMALCRQAEGAVLTKTITTEAFGVQLPR